MTTLRLWALLRRRSRVDRHDPAVLTGTLATLAFATTTAVALVVLGGLLAFIDRAARPPVATGYAGETYVILASIAVVLLLVPLITLGGAAARLAVARRDVRLATLRLTGATTAQVTFLTVLDAAVQAVVGAVAGIVWYVVLLPVVGLLSFQGRRLGVAELWVGLGPVLAVCAGIVLVAVISALASLQRVAVTPLGVTARVTPPGLRAVRLISVLLALVALAVVNTIANGGAGAVVILLLAGTIAIGMATLNVIGPWLLGRVGHLVADRARSVPTLLAARRLVDDPRTAWRSVGGVALATFIAGATALVALLPGADSANAGDAVVLADMFTGGVLTLTIAGVLAAVSTGVIQAGRVIDQRGQYRALALAGTERSVLDAARFRETLIPLLSAVGAATVVMLAFLVPVLGLSLFAQPQVVVYYLVAVLGAGLLVLAGAAATRRVAHRVSEAVG